MEVEEEVDVNFELNKKIEKNKYKYYSYLFKNMNNSNESDYFTYFDEATRKNITKHKYFYTQPERDFVGEQRFNDYRTLTISFVSNPNCIEDTYNFFKTKKISAGQFIREYDMLKIKKRKLSHIREEYEQSKHFLEGENKQIIQKLSEKDYSSLSNKERKIINRHYRSKFIIQRFEYYNRIMDNTFDFIKN